MSGDGLSTAVHPDSSAGATFHIGIARGKFHGDTSPTTPMGFLKVYAKVRSSSAGAVTPTEQPRLTGGEFQHGPRPVHLAARLAQQLALFAGDHGGDLRGPFAEDAAGRGQVRGPFDRATAAPGRKCGGGRVDRLVDVDTAGFGELTDHIGEIGGIDVLPDLPRLRGDPLSVDEVEPKVL
ncbi:hypothetical protein GCM10018966_020140 [Streptomyces yanii]